MSAVDLSEEGGARLAATAASSLPLSSPAPHADDAYYQETSVLFSLPRSAVLTEAGLQSRELAHFLAHPDFKKHLREKRLQLPRNFVFALWLLYQQHARGQPHADPLWRAWADVHAAMRTGADALVFWSGAELAELEEARLSESAAQLRGALEAHFTELVEPLSAMFHQCGVGHTARTVPRNVCNRDETAEPTGGSAWLAGWLAG